MATSHVFVKDRAGPLLASPTAAANVVHLHAFIDHQIITVIVNNRTALTVYSTPRSALSNFIELFGVDGSDITATMDAWDLNSVV